MRFFLQQCIECIIKGILIENKFIDNAKDFNHNPEYAIELFYKQTNSISIKYYESIKEELKNIKDFESRLIKIVGITNLFTEEYNLKIKTCPSNFMVNSIALQAIGLKESSSKEDVYRYIEKVKYTNILIYCIAILIEMQALNVDISIFEQHSKNREEASLSSKILKQNPKAKYFTKIRCKLY